jgi:hypothetical protein
MTSFFSLPHSSPSFTNTPLPETTYEAVPSALTIYFPALSAFIINSSGIFVETPFYLVVSDKDTISIDTVFINTTCISSLVILQVRTIQPASMLWSIFLLSLIRNR